MGAVFVAAGAKETAISWNDLVYMQDMTPAACAEAPLNTRKTLKDMRDNSTYTITRIKNQTDDDALCWMTQNLRLVGNRTLTSDDTDIESRFFLPASITLNASYDIPKQFTRGDRYQAKVYYDNNTGFGAYYNWYTATAGIGDSIVIKGGDIAQYSICPKGWRLPTGGNSGEFHKLTNGLTVTDITSNPYNFTYAGHVGDSILSNTEKGGYYWSATLGNVTSAYIFIFTNSNVGVAGGSTYDGYSVRCVAR